MVENKIIQSEAILKNRHYLRKAKPTNDYWVSFYAQIIEEYTLKFIEDFSLVIYGDENEEFDFYAIPFASVKSLLTHKNYDPHYRRWVFTIRGNELRIHGGSERINVASFKGNEQLFLSLLEKSRDFALNQQAALQRLKIGDVITNHDICEIFQCGPQGGMRKSLRTNSLVIISDHTKDFYDDRWMGNILHYTGMGLKGDQSITFAQNKTLAESGTNGIDVHLFEVYKPKHYAYSGRVELAESPYWETQLDIEGNSRKVVIFPLRIKDDVNKGAISQSILFELQDEKERKARRLPIVELAARARTIHGPASQRTVSSTMFSRDPYVSTFAKARAHGVCQLCQESAPFLDRNNEPYLETHHIRWLSKGGDDSVQNTVALCPNCHKKMHILNLEEDRERLFAAIGESNNFIH